MGKPLSQTEAAPDDQQAATAAIEAFWQQLQDKRASSGQLKHFC
jgi:hypothetical protein